MPDNATQIVSELRKKYPKIYDKLVSKKLTLPPKRLRELTRKAQALCDGEEAAIPVCRNTFLVQFRLYWEECDSVGLTFVGYKAIPNSIPKDSHKRERGLTKLVWDLVEEGNGGGDRLVNRLYDEVYGSKPYKAFTKRVRAYDKELTAAGIVYDFDYDRDIGLEYEAY